MIDTFSVIPHGVGHDNSARCSCALKFTVTKDEVDAAMTVEAWEAEGDDL